MDQSRPAPPERPAPPPHPAADSGAAQPVPGRLRGWVISVALAETVGFAVPVSTGVAAEAAGWPAAVRYGALVLAGAVEGALLGFGQAHCLVGWGVLPRRRGWVLATAVGAALAWSVGLLPSTVPGWTWSPGSAALVVFGGVALLSSLPLAQLLVLRGWVERPLRWLVVNLLAWVLGLMWTLLPSPVVDETTPTAVLAGIYLVAGVAMALTVAVVTGIGALSFLVGPTSDGARTVQRRLDPESPAARRHADGRRAHGHR